MKTSKYAIVEEDYDNVNQSFHNSYDTTQEFSDQIQRFVSELPENAYILNIGGTVSECAYFLEKGFNVTNIDVSQQMLNIIKDQLPHVHVVKDSIHSFHGDEFDGIWACRSLIHIPPEDMDTTLTNIYTLTKPGGVFATINFTTETNNYIEEELPEEHTDSANIMYYRVLWNANVLKDSISLAGFNITSTEHIKDSDHEDAIYIKAIKKG